VSDCLFCGIVAGELEASRVDEDERTVSFLDIRPIAPGHTLVVPRKHAARLAELDPDDGAALFRTGQRLAAALRAEGVNFFLADGEAAGQEVFHVHLHVVPRAPGDGFGLRFPPGYRIRGRAELDAEAERIRSAL
jgi:histidine triad (HIT) family protein